MPFLYFLLSLRRVDAYCTTMSLCFLCLRMRRPLRPLKLTSDMSLLLGFRGLPKLATKLHKTLLAIEAWEFCMLRAFCNAAMLYALRARMFCQADAALRETAIAWSRWIPSNDVSSVLRGAVSSDIVADAAITQRAAKMTS